MAIIRCDKGHYYDNKKFSTCPHCNKVNVGTETNMNKEEALHDNRTASLLAASMGADPVTGWLVCVSGAEKGRDYRLHSGKNTIGRSWKMSICIVEDMSIASENHAYIMYDPENFAFTLKKGEGETFLNDVSTEHAVELKVGDKIKIGKSEFRFIPYCCPERNWSKE